MPLRRLFQSRKFWLALFGVAQTIVFALNPNFPGEVWKAIDALVAILITLIAAEDVAAFVAGTRAS